MSWSFSWVLFNIYTKTYITAQELDNVLCYCGINVVYIYQIQHLIVALICVSERVTNVEI